MKKFKKFMAFVMTGVLLASPLSSIVASAAGDTSIVSGDSPAAGSATASGEVEGYVSTDVFKVVLPTSAEGTFDFILDPQQLINATSGDAYTGAKFADNATVFFNTASADASGDYKSQSNFVQVLNKGTVKVNVAVTATLADVTGVTMASGDTFTDTTPSLYLAFVASGDASGDAGKVFTADGATLSAVMDAADDSFYEYSYDAGTNKYKYDLKADYVSGDASDFPDYSFALKGACNPDADWSNLTTVAPKVNITWTLTNAEAPVAPKTAYELKYNATTGSTLVLDLGSGSLAATDVTSAIAPSGSTWTKAASANNLGTKTWYFDASTSTLYIAPGFGMTAGAKSKLNLNDAANTVVTITYK